MTYINVGTVLKLRRTTLYAGNYGKERESLRTVAYLDIKDGVFIVRFVGSKVTYRLEGDRLWSKHTAYEIV